MLRPWFLVIDVESVGLHGVGFAVGAALLNQEGHLTDEFFAACDPESVPGDAVDLDWVRDNVKLDRYTHKWPYEVRATFWEYWRSWVETVRRSGYEIYLTADVSWPVEANFLSACVRDNWPDAKWQGPYPLIDIASIRLAAGYDPLEVVRRLRDEKPPHNPLADARQSARLLTEALFKIDLAQQVAIERTHQDALQKNVLGPVDLP